MSIPNLCKKINLATGGEKMVKSLSPQQSEWAYKKWCEGYSQEQIADALYVSKGVIMRAIDGRPRIREPLKCPYK